MELIVAKLKKYNLKGKEVGTISVDDRLANAGANGQMIKDYIVSLRKNARQWSASTKGRSEVSHSTKKPRQQKGSGNARQGSLAAPQFRGGGIVFGPKPKFDQHVRINQKERKAAVRAILAEKIRNGKLHVIDSIEIQEPKTKVVAEFLKSLGLNRRVLFVCNGDFQEIQVENETTRISVKSHKHTNFAKSLQNIPFGSMLFASNLNGYDAMVAHDIVLTEEALNEITEWLC